MGVKFNYYYGKEAEAFSFFRIPKLLFTDEAFRVLSSDAKVLYGILLDRMSLSMKNGWIDEENKVYIIFTIEEIAQTCRLPAHTPLPVQSMCQLHYHICNRYIRMAANVPVCNRCLLRIRHIRI